MNNELKELAMIIACDIANEILELSKNNIVTTKYDQEVFDHLKHNDPTFYISSQIGRYDQIDERNVKERVNNYSHILYVDDLPITLITTDIREEDSDKLSYNYYPLDDDKCLDIISSDCFYLLNANDFGFYLINDNDYYPISPSPFLDDRFMDQVKELNISINKVDRGALDLTLIDKKGINIHIKDFDKIDDPKLTLIKDRIKESEEELPDMLFGPIPLYQYYFTSGDNIEVCDHNRENGSYCFGTVNDSKVKSLVYYDGFEDEIEIDDIPEMQYDGSYFVSLSDVGYVFADRIIVNDGTSYSLLDRSVANKIQKKIIKERPVFETYDLKTI